MPRVTVGRAFVLLLVGIGIGVTIYVRSALSPEVLQTEVDAVLRQYVRSKVEFGEIDLGLDAVTISDLRVLYPDGAAAVAVDRIVITIDQIEALRGEVIVRQIDVHGLQLALRPDAEGNPMPGVEWARPEKSDKQAPLPLVRLHAGATIAIAPGEYLATPEPIVLRCDEVTVDLRGNRYAIATQVRSDRLEELRVGILFEPALERAQAEVELSGLRVERGDLALLEPLRRRFLGDAALPPCQIGATISGKAEARVRGSKLTRLQVEAQLEELEFAWGNFYTGETLDYPYALKRGSARATFDGRTLVVADVRGRFSTNEAGTIAAGFTLDLESGAYEVSAEGRGIAAATKDLEVLVPPDIVEAIIAPYRPSGLFDVDLRIAETPGQPQKVVVDVRLLDNQLLFVGQYDETLGRRVGFPYPLEQVRGRVLVETVVSSPQGPRDQILLQELTARHPVRNPVAGAPDHVRVTAEGAVYFYPHPDGTESEEIDLRIVAHDLPLDEDLDAGWAGTPEGSRPYPEFELTGSVERLALHVTQRAGIDRGPGTSFDVLLKDCTLVYAGFPLPVEGVAGRLVAVDSAPGADGVVRKDIVFDELTGRVAGGGRATANATISDAGGPTEQVRITIEADDVGFGDELTAAIAKADADALAFWREVRPSGRANGRFEIAPNVSGRLTILLDGNVELAGLRGCDCPVSGLRGRVVWDEAGISFGGLAGEIDSSPFRIRQGALRANGALQVEADAPVLELSPRLIALLEKAAGGTPFFERAALEEGRLGAKLTLRRTSAHAALTTTARLDRIDLRCAPRDLPMRIRGGPVHYEAGAFRIDSLWCELDDGATAEITLASVDPAQPLVRATLRLRDLDPASHLDRLFGTDLAAATGKTTRIDTDALQIVARDGFVRLVGAVQVRRGADERGVYQPTGRFRFEPLEVTADGDGRGSSLAGAVVAEEANFNVELDAKDLSGRLSIQAGGWGGNGFFLRGPVTGFAGDFFDKRLDETAFELAIDSEFLTLRRINGRFSDGRLRGQLLLHLAEPSGFELGLEAIGGSLAAFLGDAARRDSIRGTFHAVVNAASRSGRLRDLEGSGRIEIRDARLFPATLLRQLVARMARLVRIDLDDRFRTAEAEFTLRGETIDVERFRLSTGLTDVLGNGTVSLYGDLNLLAEPQVNSVLDFTSLLNLRIIGRTIDLIRKPFYEIRIFGTIDSPEVAALAFPFLRGEPRPFPSTPYDGRLARRRPRILPAPAAAGTGAVTTTRRRARADE